MHDRQREGGEEEQGQSHDEPLAELDRASHLRAEESDEDGAEEDEIPQRHDDRAIFGTERPAEEGRHESGSRGQGPAGPADLREMKERVNGAPEARAGPAPHEAGEDGLARGEGVARHLGIEKGLQQDGHGADPEKRRPPSRRHHRAQHPVARAEREAEQDGARPDDADDVPERVGRGLGQVGVPPAHAWPGRGGAHEGAPRPNRGGQ